MTDFHNTGHYHMAHNGQPVRPQKPSYVLSGEVTKQTTGRFDSRWELESYVFDRCISEGRAQLHVAEEVQVSGSTVSLIIKSFYEEAEAPKMKLPPLPAIDDPSVKKTTGHFESRAELERFVFDECINKGRKKAAVARDADISLRTVYNILNDTPLASNSIEIPEF